VTASFASNAPGSVLNESGQVGHHREVREADSAFATLFAGAVAGFIYFAASQLAGLAYLFLATWRGWQVPGYHEPAHWWSWLLLALWCAGFVGVVLWASRRYGSRSWRGAGGAAS